jgi:hypothetical protein
MVMTTGLKNYSDIHYTKPAIAKAIIKHYQPTGKILEPFRGGGVFFSQLPEGTQWCEIEQGRDFLDHVEHVNWIVTNPPFKELTSMMEHAFNISENVVFLLPISKVYSSAPRLDLIDKYGGIKEQFLVGRGRDIGFDIGFPFAAMHFQRGYSGPIFNTKM